MLDELIAGVDERRKATAPRETYVADIKRRLDAATKYSFATDDLLVLNFIALGSEPTGKFLHDIRRVMTEADFFRVCAEFLDHGERMPLDPFPAAMKPEPEIAST